MLARHVVVSFGGFNSVPDLEDQSVRLVVRATPEFSEHEHLTVQVIRRGRVLLAASL